MTDEQILLEQVNLDSPDCIVSNKDKTRLKKILLDNKSVGSLQEEIGNCPVKVDTVLDSSHVTLADLSGKLIHGVFDIKRIKPAFIRTDAGPIGNAKELEKHMSPKFLDKEGVQIAITDETGKFMPEIISQSICMAGNLETNPVGENFQFPVIELKEVSPNRGKDGHDNWEKEEEDLASFLKIKGIKGPLAALPKRVRKHIENLPTEGAELTPVRARFRHGNLQILFKSKDPDGTDQWIAMVEHPKLAKEFKFLPDVEIDPKIHYGRV